MRKLIPAVVYVRMSGEKQERSPDEQRAAIKKYAAEHGYKIIREYFDAGISGDATEHRPEFRRMIADAASGDFEVVLCWDQDRFGRFDPLEAGFWIQPLRAAGVTLATVASGPVDWDSFAGRVIYAVSQEAKNAFLVDLSRNVTRGMKAGAEAGYWLGGKAPYGYTAEEVAGETRSSGRRPKKLVVNEREAAEVRWLFETYTAKDVSCRWLAEQLTARGVAPPVAPEEAMRRHHKRVPERWCPQTIRAILRNRAYTGDSVWSRNHHCGYHGVVAGEIVPWAKRPVKEDGPRRFGSKAKVPGTKFMREQNEDANVIVREDAHTAIVSRELFQAVQDRLQRRRLTRTPIQNHGDWLLGGVLVCSHCGAPLMGCRQETSDGTRHYYRCQTNAHFGTQSERGCTYNSVDEQSMVSLILEKAKRAILNARNIQLAREELARQKAAHDASVPNEVQALRDRLASLEAEVRQGTINLTRLPVELLSDVSARLVELRREVETLKETIAAMENPPALAAQEVQVERDEDMLWRLEEVAQSADRLALRAFLKDLVEKVELVFEERQAKRRTGSQYAKKCMRLSRGVIYLREQRRLTLNQNISTAGTRGTPALL